MPQRRILPIDPTPYRIGEHITYINYSGDIQQGWIRDIDDEDITDEYNNMIRNRLYYFTPTQHSRAAPKAMNYVYVERLPNGRIIHQDRLIKMLTNSNELMEGDPLLTIIPPYVSRIINTGPLGNIGGTNYIENNNRTQGNTGGTSGGRRKRSHRNRRSRRHRSMRHK